MFDYFVLIFFFFFQKEVIKIWNAFFPFGIFVTFAHLSQVHIQEVSV